MADPASALNDIIGPASPVHAGSGAHAYLVGALAGAAAIALAIWAVRRLGVWRTRLGLWRLRRAHRAGRIGTHAACYRLAAELRRHFGTHRLDARTAPPHAGASWAVLLRRLDRLRYGPPRRQGGPERQARQWRRVCAAAARRLPSSPRSPSR